MQRPTIDNFRIRYASDAEVLFHAVHLKKLPKITRRLDDEERASLKPGDVYVWEEHGTDPSEPYTLSCMQRFTDGRSWGASKAREDFLLYYEKEPNNHAKYTANLPRWSSPLIKATYSAFVHNGPDRIRKWHLNAYYLQDTVDQMSTIDDIPLLRAIRVPAGRYECARSNSPRRFHKQSRTNECEENNEVVPHEGKTFVSSVSPSAPTAVYSQRHVVPSSAIQRCSKSPSDIPPHRRLAPLEFLQNLPSSTRDPNDDQVLSAFRHSPTL